MYHDQGLIPVKLLGFDQAVNLTLGLPIVRTSVDHGTAFGIVGKNAADPGSLKAAIRLACKLATNRNHNGQASAAQTHRGILRGPRLKGTLTSPRPPHPRSPTRPAAG